MTRFLYVEDDNMSRQVVEIMLTKAMGFSSDELTMFEDSKNFREKLRALTTVPEVIFLDIHMQPHDGYEVLKMIREEPRFAKACVIAMTAGVMTSDIELLREAGFNGMIGKPIRKRQFPDLLNRILDGEAIWFTS